MKYPTNKEKLSKLLNKNKKICKFLNITTISSISLGTSALAALIVMRITNQNSDATHVLSIAQPLIVLTALSSNIAQDCFNKKAQKLRERYLVLYDSEQSDLNTPQNETNDETSQYNNTEESEIEM